MLKRIPNPSKVKGIKVFESFLIANGSAICLPGFGILISSSIPESISLGIIQHEYGHYLDYLHGIEGDQKKFLGSSFLGFYLKIGLPSLLNLIPGFNRLPWFKGPHRVFWTETRANRLAQAYFQNELAEGFSRRFPTQA